MTIEKRIEKLEEDLEVKPQDRGLIVIWPGENKEKKCNKYQAKHGHLPGFAIIVTRENETNRDRRALE